ncbi:uncharacterized protein BXZ73DRAFT_89088 [Epithele typhae]|uniref:uncharacterized protein n=1 Tax=Epithele typhae TaxID=378194 RepID=UPI0020079CF6|nr:uncharacterized protein BXZ73DRAFT_89088 [Epithele typhae]KAH9938995.1 hypothetical protein BXZ73DRAFT_89088 [Epithele typhae]
MSVPAAPRPRHVALGLSAAPSSPLSSLFDADRKLALEGTSPKPCIVPGNALHLIDDDPAAPRSATPPSVIVVGDESEYGAEPDSSSSSDAEGAGRADRADRPAPRVRFRSRVRITSGVHRHRVRAHVAAAGGSTPGSSTSESPSSSISAPLRYQADENAAWGPIGRRLSAYASSGSWSRRQQQQQQQPQGRPVIHHLSNGRGGYGAAGAQGTMTRHGMRGVRGSAGAHGRGERGALLRPSWRQMYGDEEEDEDEVARMPEAERALRAAALRREEEAVFGRWPWRIFNRHWWWWHMEPVMCCCSDEDEYEEL